jgi:hypothetical protein
MCIRTSPAPAFATIGNISSSAPPEMSFTTDAPAASASVAIAA